MADKIKIDWKKIREKAPYAPEAFDFVREGLAHTVKLIHGDGVEAVKMGDERHVSGQQLCLGLRDWALEKYGLLAKTVLGRWGVNKTDDFGRIVFAMIDAGLMRKSDEDEMGDFSGVYDFEEAFGTTDLN